MLSCSLLLLSLYSSFLGFLWASSYFLFILIFVSYFLLFHVYKCPLVSKSIGFEFGIESSKRLESKGFIQKFVRTDLDHVFVGRESGEGESGPAFAVFCPALLSEPLDSVTLEGPNSS